MRRKKTGKVALQVAALAWLLAARWRGRKLR
jgi:hypothetical protein